jgi:hypothetical protein
MTRQSMRFRVFAALCSTMWPGMSKTKEALRLGTSKFLPKRFRI